MTGASDALCAGGSNARCLLSSSSGRPTRWALLLSAADGPAFASSAVFVTLAAIAFAAGCSGDGLSSSASRCAVFGGLRSPSPAVTLLGCASAGAGSGVALLGAATTTLYSSHRSSGDGRLLLCAVKNPVQTG